MKQIPLYLITLFLTSCMMPNYYQIYKVSQENGSSANDNIVFEDKNCKIYYNLWDEGGDAGFFIYNKTDDDMQIDLTKSFFILNGISHEYFQQRIFTKSASAAAIISTVSNSTSFEEKPTITIPTKTMTKISEFHISTSRYINCDLPKFPTVRNIITVKFDKPNSPFIFYNLITYTIKNETTRFENKFYVSEVTNIPESEMFTTADRSLCGKKLEMPVKVFKDSTPDKFYVKYIKEN